MNGAGGFAKVWRGVYGHPAFRDAVEEAAFIWLIGKAAWQPARVRYKDRVIHLKRGQLALSVRDLAAGFRWSKGTAERFLDRLKTETMVETDVGTGVQIVTICNYDTYQASSDGAGTGVGTGVGTGPGQDRDTEQRKEERKKEDSPPTPPRGSAQTFLPADWKPDPIAELTPKAKQLAEQWPPGAYETVAEGFALFWQSRNRKMVDWGKTWRGWIIREHWRVMQEARRQNGGASDSGWREVMGSARV